MSNEPTDNAREASSDPLRSIREYLERCEPLKGAILPFIMQLSDEELYAINSGAIPKTLMDILISASRGEIERRWSL